MAARRRLRETYRYSYRRGIACDLDLAAVRALVESAWPRDAGLALRRLDRTRGFTRDNVALVPTAGGRPRATTSAKLWRRLERLAARRDLLGSVSVDDLAALFERQRGRCPVSGRALQTAGGLDDPDAIAVVLVDASRAPTRSNIMLVTMFVAHAAGRWGLEALLCHAGEIASAQERRARSRDGRSKSSNT